MKHLFKLSLLLLAFLLPATALAHDFEVDGFYFNINGNEATVTYKGTSYSQYSNEYSGDVTIPATVTLGGTTYTVTSIGHLAFYGCSGLTSITIPNSVTSIGYGAFEYCSGLTSIDIPNSVTSIGGFAFSGCSSLTNVVVASGNPNYDSRNNCNAIIETTSNTLITGCKNTFIPNSVSNIGEYAFMGCYGLTSITIPNSVISIGYMAFDSCYRLTSIDIPNSVTSIGGSVFSGCSGLTSMVVASGNPTYDSRNNCNAIIETASNTLIYGCKNTIIPNSVTSIGEGAFYHSTSLTSIEIPNSVTAIGYIAFYDCTSLTSIEIPNSVTSIGHDAFKGTTWYNNQPDGLVYAGLVAYKYKGTMPSGTSITLRNGTLGIAGMAFIDCSNLTNIDIPNSLTTISDDAFLRCNGLANITIPNSVTTIGSGAFSGCSSMTSVSIGNSVTTIADWMFDGCSGLTSVTIPNTVTSIGVHAFSGCTGLTSVTIPNSITSIGAEAFWGCEGLTSVTIGNSVTSIGGYAFYGCSGIASMTIPNSVTSIGNYAFENCSGLTEIYCLALTPPTIDSYTFFYRCYGATLCVPKEVVNAYKAAKYWKNFTNIVGVVLPGYIFEEDGIYYRVTDENVVSVIANEGVEAYYTGDVVIPDSVTYEGNTFAVTGIERNAFDGCYELTSITIPNTVESIGEQAFQGCTGLTSVTIGNGVTAIGARAFNYCNALASVKCIGTVPPVMANADCFSTAAYNRATLIVPRNYEPTYAAADYWYKFAHIDGWGSAGRGDIDGDGEVSIRDVTRMIDAILTGEHEGVYFESADLNSNGRLDIGDVTTIIDMLLNGE